MFGRRRKKQAFTLIELLVVIAIIGILIALLLPAIQAAREAARKLACKNNVKSIGLALHSYSAMHKMLPINWGEVSGTPTKDNAIAPSPTGGTRGFSWICMLLPFIEEDSLYKQINFTAAPAANMVVANKQLSLFRCPSDSIDESIYAKQALCSGTTNYKSVAGGNWPGTTSGTGKYQKGAALGGRNYDAYNGLDFGDGWCCRGASNIGGKGRPVTTTLDQVAVDGTSQTLAVGEAVPEYCNWSTWFNFEGAIATCAIPMNWKKSGSLDSIAAIWTDSMSFRSRHSGGVNFCFLDGHTKFLSQDIDIGIYRALASIDGGEVIPNSGKL